MTQLYKLLNANGSPSNGGAGRYSLPTADGPGDWMPAIDNLELCNRGYHICEFDALLQWRGEKLYRAEARGKTVADKEKSCHESIRLVSCVEAWNEKNLRLFAADLAEHVLSLFESQFPEDPRPRLAIAAARDFANGAIEVEAMKAAAEAAAWAAARGASTAAEAAAWAAAEAAQAVAAAAAAVAARAMAVAAAAAAAWAAVAERNWQYTRLREILGEPE